MSGIDRGSDFNLVFTEKKMGQFDSLDELKLLLQQIPSWKSLTDSITHKWVNLTPQCVFLEQETHQVSQIDPDFFCRNLWLSSDVYYHLHIHK